MKYLTQSEDVLMKYVCKKRFLENGYKTGNIALKEGKEFICPLNVDPKKVAKSYEKILTKLGEDCHVEVVYVPVIVPCFKY